MAKKNNKTQAEKEKSYLEMLALAKILEKRQAILIGAGCLVGALKAASEGAGFVGILWKAACGAAVAYSAGEIANWL